MADERETKDSVDSLASHDSTRLVQVPETLGYYRLTRMIGRGGMGEVWLALDTKLERDVAIKVMRRELIAREDAVKRFYREARAIARLNHPNIVQVHAISEEGEMIYMVMEMVDGETVSQRLKRVNALPLDECVALMLQAVEGLGYASARGIIHRDIKPSNMMLTSDFRLKITDFGLAKMIEHDTQMTAAGTAMGSPNYMSPEQARGEEADHRSDIYGLGISFYQMLTNTLPFTAQTPLTVLLKQIQDPLPEPDLLRELQQGKVLNVIKKMTAKKADDRYQTYGGLSAALSALAPNVRIKPAAHAATSSMPRPGDDSQPVPGESQLSAASTRFEAGPGTPPAPPTPLSPTPAAPTPTFTQPSTVDQAPRKSTQTPLLVAGVVVVALCVLGIVAVTRIMSVPSDQPQVARPAPSPRTKPQIAAPTPEPSPASGTQVTPAPSVTASARPTVPPTPTVATPRPTPPPTPITFEAKSITLGKPGTLAGAPVALFDMAGAQVASLGAGARVEFLGSERLPSGAVYRVRHEGKELLVRYEDAHLETNPSPPDSRPARQGLVVVLGSKQPKPDEMVSIFPDQKSSREMTRLPAGTELPASEDPLGYWLELPDGRKGYVFKGLATPKK